MPINLLNVFKSADLKECKKTTKNIVSLAFKSNKKTGARIARAVLDDGTTLIKEVFASGVISQKAIQIPPDAQRNEVIKDLAKNKLTQETIAAMLDISQSTVSNVLRKK